MGITVLGVLLHRRPNFEKNSQECGYEGGTKSFVIGSIGTLSDPMGPRSLPAPPASSPMLCCISDKCRLVVFILK